MGNDSEGIKTEINKLIEKTIKENKYLLQDKSRVLTSISIRISFYQNDKIRYKTLIDSFINLNNLKLFYKEIDNSMDKRKIKFTELKSLHLHLLYAE